MLSLIFTQLPCNPRNSKMQFHGIQLSWCWSGCISRGSPCNLSRQMKQSPSVKKSLEIQASYWEVIEELIAELSPLAKATKLVCSELHVGLSFIYPMICNPINTSLCVQESDMGGIHSVTTTVREQLVIHFKLESDGLEESIPVVACLLHPHFKHLQFLYFQYSNMSDRDTPLFCRISLLS